MVKYIVFLLISLDGLLVGCSKPSPGQTRGPSAQDAFDKALATHLDAVRHADLVSLEPTIADDVLLILPKGDTLTSKKAFMNLHDDWFSEKNWEWSPVILKSEATDSLAYALVRYVYTQKDSTNVVVSRRSDYLVLIFRNSKKGWQLVHDQNTAAPAE